MLKSPPRESIAYGHIVMGAAGWIAFLFLQHVAVAVLAGILTLLAIPRFIRGPREKAAAQVMQKLRSAQHPKSKLLQKHMLPGEEFRMELHEHPIVLIGWWIGAVVWSALTGLIALYPAWGTHIHWQPLWIFVFWVVGMIPPAIRVILWRVDRICVTNKRIFAVEGFIRREFSMIPLEKVTGKNFIEPWHGRLLESLRLVSTTYGRIRLETASSKQLSGTTGKGTKLSNLIYLPNVLEVFKTFLPDVLPDKVTDGD